MYNILCKYKPPVNNDMISDILPKLTHGASRLYVK